MYQQIHGHWRAGGAGKGAGGERGDVKGKRERKWVIAEGRLSAMEVMVGVEVEDASQVERCSCRVHALYGRRGQFRVLDCCNFRACCCNGI